MATIYKRGSMWYSLVRIGGKRIRQPLSRDKKQAQVKLAQLIQGKVETARPARWRPDWEWFKGWYLKDLRAKTVHPTQTLETDAWAIGWLERSQPVRLVTDVTPDRLLQLQSEMKPGLSPWTVNRCLAALKTMMRKAEDELGLVPQNWRKVKCLAHAKGRTIAYEPEQLKKYLAAAPGYWTTCVWLGGRAGLRPAEIKWLQVADVDFTNECLLITPKGPWIPKKAKSRVVPLFADLRAHLLELAKQRNRLGTWRPDDFVFADPRTGQGPALGTMTTMMRRFQKKAGLRWAPIAPIYVLRHTFASQCSADGFTGKEVAEMMGHTEATMTANYTHLFDSALKAKVRQARGVLR